MKMGSSDQYQRAFAPHVGNPRPPVLIFSFCSIYRYVLFGNYYGMYWQTFIFYINFSPAATHQKFPTICPLPAVKDDKYYVEVNFDEMSKCWLRIRLLVVPDFF